MNQRHVNHGMAVCGTCDRDFYLHSNARYTIDVCGDLYDAFDCPHCGCQNVYSRRWEEADDDTDADKYIEAFLDQMFYDILEDVKDKEGSDE